MDVASCEGHEAVVRVLLEGGADVNKITDDGYTPLHIASSKGHEAVVRVLLEGGADISKAANNGCTPRSVAKVPEIISMLDRAAETQSAQ